MQKLKLSAEGLIAAAILNALVFALGSARLAWIPTVAALAILSVVLAFDRQQARSFGESIAYAACCGLLLATAAMLPLQQYFHEFIASTEALPGRPLLPAVWLLCLLGFLTADRVRNNTTPTTVQLRPPTPAGRATPVLQPEQPREPAVLPAAPAPLPVSANAIEAKSQPAPDGKPVTIHVNLLGMGIVCLRPIQAERLSKDFYRIVESVPEGEQWQFQTGQVVRCRKERLSNGKGLVAFEEAPRAVQPVATMASEAPVASETPAAGVAFAASTAPTASPQPQLPAEDVGVTARAQTPPADHFVMQPVAAPGVPMLEDNPLPAATSEPAPTPVAPSPTTPNAIPANAPEIKSQPAPQGKPVTIHVNLVGMGISCLRPIQAERLGKDFYRIVEQVPEDEEWEFQTGQIVRCRKQSLSSGKGLVAFEEAPRAN